ncbi:MAG TPA: transposase [Dehalococcoidia bacterium]|nr:transposase [Dehalococcoidia bacterium]
MHYQKLWREPILNHLGNRTTNGYTEGCNTKIKMLKRNSYGIRNVEVYWRKMLLGLVPSRSCFHVNITKSRPLLDRIEETV